MQLPDESKYALALAAIYGTASSGHLAMLEAHFRSPNRRVTASELAHAAGYANYSAANLQYGAFAHRLCNELGFVPQIGNSGEPTYTYVIASSSKISDSEWEWTMHEVVAHAIEATGFFGARGQLPSTEPIHVDDIEDTDHYIEGAKLRVTVNAYERNRKARTVCLDYWGAVCSACEIDFETVYGVSRDRCIHIHHLKPLSTVGEAYEIDPINDLRPVCPNCHTVLHTAEPPMEISELRKRLLAKKIANEKNQ